jgi:Pin2-interacting protein X1
LGAKRGSERAENFGLAGLESILGRLNGNEAEVKKEEERREEIEKRAFVYRKYGMMNFVSGGFLVGDKITKNSDIKKEVEIKTEIKSEPESDDGTVDKASKKRKREERAEDDSKLKRKKKSGHLGGEVKDTGSDSSKANKNKKDKKKDKSKKSKRTSSSDPEPSTTDAPTPASDPEPLTDKARYKAEKKARKEEKKLKKALKKAAKKASKASDDSVDSSSEGEGEESATTLSSVPVSGTSTPVLASAGLTFNPRGMHAVRQRWIRQKKAATMDAQAMKEASLNLSLYLHATDSFADFYDQNTIIALFGRLHSEALGAIISWSTAHIGMSSKIDGRERNKIMIRNYAQACFP